MRIVLLGLLALAFTLPPAVQAQTLTRQQANRPSLRSTFVVPANRGEARRVTPYARRPVQRGRLARQYRGLRANRTYRSRDVGSATIPARGTRVLHRTTRTPRRAYVRRGGTHFQVTRR